MYIEFHEEILQKTGHKDNMLYSMLTSRVAIESTQQRSRINKEFLIIIPQGGKHWRIT